MASTRLNIVAIGKTGDGKSQTLKTICDGQGPFQPSRNGCSAEATQGIVRHTQLFDNNVELCLIDTPGLFDTEDSDNEEVLNAISSIYGGCTDGIHAFLVVMSAATPRDNQEKIKALQVLQDYYGEHFWEYVIIVFTSRNEMEIHDESEDEFIKSRKPEIQEYIRKAGGGIWFVENLRSSPENKRECVRRLVEMVQRNVAQRKGPYTNAIFKYAQEVLARRMKEEQRPRNDLENEAAKNGWDWKSIGCTALRLTVEAGLMTAVGMVAGPAIAICGTGAVAAGPVVQQVAPKVIRVIRIFILKRP